MNAAAGVGDDRCVRPGDGGFFTLMGIAVFRAVATVGTIYLIGGRLVRPVFHHLASSRQPGTSWPSPCFPAWASRAHLGSRPVDGDGAMLDRTHRRDRVPS